MIAFGQAPAFAEACAEACAMDRNIRKIFCNL